ncbi:MAG: hypothetical protein ACREMZ_08940 [Gemmatimonadales bacterium]
MPIRSTLLILSTLHMASCSSRGQPPRDPGSPAPVAGPVPATAPTANGRPGPGGLGTEHRRVPVRADQAPLVEVRDALENDSLLGRRVRVAGRCAAAGKGRKAGSWTLEADGRVIEVRGRVPHTCFEQEATELTIFAQIERKVAGSRDRLLLRLPD